MTSPFAIFGGRRATARNAARLLCMTLAGAPFALACQAETGPGAPPRKNGCIDLGCPPVETATPGGGDAGPDGSRSMAYGNPLEGTSKQASLVRGRFHFTEGPVWIGGRLLFTDTVANTIHEVTAGGTFSTFRENSEGANGLALDKDGNLLACEGTGKRVSKSAAATGASKRTIAETFNDAQLNAPNDVIARADGNVYFTDPSYSGDPTQNDEAVYRIDPGGNLSRIESDFAKPNGIALSPDHNTLYVVDNGAGKLLAATVDGTGTVGTFTQRASVPGGDGMAVDDVGNLYVADDNGIDVFDKNGSKLGTVSVDAQASNCTFGGVDRQTLYITANAPDPGNGQPNPKTGLYSIRLNIPGLP
jgi:gluconolactonase